MTTNCFRFGLLALIAGQISANSIYLVGIDTSTLPSASGPYRLYLNLLDGSGIGDANNTATLDTFACTGISLSGCPSGVHSLTDSSFSTSTTFGFTAGGDLAFRVALTGNIDANLVPDSFQLSIVDRSVNPLPTTDPSGSDAVLFAQIDQSSPILQSYGSPDGATISLSPPVITIESPVPEPALGLPIFFGLCLVFLLSKLQNPIRGSLTRGGVKHLLKNHRSFRVSQATRKPRDQPGALAERKGSY
jgi:hypothetical protein